MTSRVLSVMMIAGAAACAPFAPATSPSLQAEAPPVRALLSERDQLALTSEQVVALDSLSRALDVTDVSGSRGDLKLSVVRRLGLGKHPDRALALVAGSHRSAMQAVEQLLRPEQRQRLCELQLARQGKAALREDKRAVARGTHSLASSGKRTETRRTWPWCSSTPERDSRTAQSDS